MMPQDTLAAAPAAADTASLLAGWFDDPAALLRALPAIAGATGALIVALVLIAWLARRAYRRLDAAGDRPLPGLRLGHLELLAPPRLADGLRWLVRLVRIAATLLVLDLYIVAVLRLLPGSTAAQEEVRTFFLRPLEVVGAGILDYLPNLLYIAVIALVTRGLLWLIHRAFVAIRAGVLRLPGFDRDWAEPTYKLLRAVILFFAVVFIFPLLPGAGSEAFKGGSVIVGVLLAFGSSGAVGNVVAGIFLTYSRAFRVGDRVRVGETFGDVVEQGFLVTRLRTDRNELVTVPSGLLFSGRVVNYTVRAGEAPVRLTASVTIGYDAPWRTVHELLLAAAAGTADVLAEPAPFVLQRALNDFSVAYDLYVHTDRPARTLWIQDELHRRIQDGFNAAGVEIMSPNYLALRDGNEVAIPDAHRPAEYRAPAFRVRREEA